LHSVGKEDDVQAATLTADMQASYVRASPMALLQFMVLCAWVTQVATGVALPQLALWVQKAVSRSLQPCMAGAASITSGVLQPAGVGPHAAAATAVAQVLAVVSELQAIC
jgi:hypothetical protein